MSTNPNNAVGTNAAYDGRTSVKAFNDGIGAYSRGILSGWACSPSTGMTVSLGGDGTTRDIAIAEDAGGNKTTVNNISEAPINVTMSAAPSTNSRIDVIVAYVDNPPQGAATSIDNPGACGLIAVDGTAAADPVAPNDSAIRTAITADGASGATAYYVVLATITIASGTTDLTSSNIAAGPSAGIGSQNIDFTTLKKWMPDYANKQALTSAQIRDYTATADGFLSLGLSKYSSNQSQSPTITIKIDNVEMAKITSGATDRGGYPQVTYTGTFPIHNGERMTNDTSTDMTNHGYFIPGKWV